MDTVEKMRAVWTRAFERDHIAADADFFELGGDSLMATVLVVHVEESFGVLLDPVEVFETPALKDFAEKVATLALSPATEGA